jgi:hypothetical protein
MPLFRKARNFLRNIVSSGRVDSKALQLIKGGRPASSEATGLKSATAFAQVQRLRHPWKQNPLSGGRALLSDEHRPGNNHVVGNILHEVYDRLYGSILYRPVAQVPESSMDFALRTSADSHRLTTAVRSTVAELDPAQPITLCLTMSEKINEQASALQFVAALMD